MAMQPGRADLSIFPSDQTAWPLADARGIRRRGLDGMTKQAPLIWFHISVVVLEVVEVPRPDAELISGDLRVEVLQLRLRLAIDLDETGHIWSATAP